MTSVNDLVDRIVRDLVWEVCDFTDIPLWTETSINVRTSILRPVKNSVTRFVRNSINEKLEEYEFN